ncbi:MAG: hypothetical protein CMH26_06380 [Micavibrio sp.]|nr:hypothetical protein [Micavibrio sp.]
MHMLKPNTPFASPHQYGRLYLSYIVFCAFLVAGVNIAPQDLWIDLCVRIFINIVSFGGLAYVLGLVYGVVKTKSFAPHNNELEQNYSDDVIAHYDVESGRTYYKYQDIEAQSRSMDKTNEI